MQRREKAITVGGISIDFQTRLIPGVFDFLLEYGPRNNFYLETPYKTERGEISGDWEPWHWVWLDPATSGRSEDSESDIPD